jgi:hypothetical protein
LDFNAIFCAADFERTGKASGAFKVRLRCAVISSTFLPIVSTTHEERLPASEFWSDGKLTL